MARWRTSELKPQIWVCSCLSQSEDITPGALYVKTEFVKVYERACHRYNLVNLYQTIPKVWLWKMVVWHFSAGKFIHASCFNVLHEYHETSNKVDILTGVLHFYSKGGLTFYWRFRGNEWCILKLLWWIQTD